MITRLFYSSNKKNRTIQKYETYRSCTSSPLKGLFLIPWNFVRNRRISDMRKRYKVPTFCPSDSFFQGLDFLENKSGNIGLLWHNNDTNASFYVGCRSLTSPWVISAINMSIICTKKFATSIFKLATEFTIFSSATTSRIIIKYQYLGKFETFWMVCYIIKHYSF